MKMTDEEILQDIYHEYDPVKRHEYYMRTRKLKGRKKGGRIKPKSNRPVLRSRSMKSIPVPTQQEQQVQRDILAKASQARMDKVQEYIRQRNAEVNKKAEERKKEAEKQKQEAVALEEKRFALENKKLDLESAKLDLDAQQADLDSRVRDLEEIRNKKGIDPIALEKADRQLKLEKSKLEIRKKKFDLESQRLDKEIQKLAPQTNGKTFQPGDLVHEYDPQKRHDYYERTKHLKGRGKGGTQTPSNRSRQGNGSGGVPNPKNVKTADQQKAEIKARVTAYKARLDKLKEVLALLVAEAKKRSADNAGTKESRAEADKKDTASKDGTSKDSGSKKDSGSSTAKEKAASKEYYEKNKDKISLKKQEANLKDQIKEVEEKIVKIRADLKDSIQKARDKTAQPSNKRKGVRQNGS